MQDGTYCQFKVWAFLKRNTALLSHDEYRAGHVGFHCANTRRLKGIRGYTVNIHDEDSALGRRLQAGGAPVVRNEPENFLSLWDGFPAVHFDSWQDWTEAGTREKTRAGAAGLEVDADWTLSDGPYLFDRVEEESTQFRSYHTRVHETVIKPVLRGEARPFKLVQFFRASPELSEAEFRGLLLGSYLPLCATLAGLNGLVANLRDPDIDAAVRGYYPDEHWCFTPEGRDFRSRFLTQWDGGNELFFDYAAAFSEARREHPLRERISALEMQLFDAVWYVAVDENMIVMPNRHRAPDFYYR